VHPGAGLSEETEGRVVAGTRTDAAVFAVVELDGGRRVLARADGDRKPAIDDVVRVRPLNDELCLLVTDAA
jgi:hypothetical protein